MKKMMMRALALGVMILPLSAMADPITIQISGSWSGSGFSASTLHAATGCSSNSDLAGASIHQCGAHGVNDDITGGTLTGDLTGGVFSSITGTLTIGGVEVAVTGGSLGGAYYDVATPTSLADFNWFLDISGFGTFYFEDMLMGNTGPNRFDGETLVLWGQNEVAYGAASRCVFDESVQDFVCTPSQRGMDLYGVRVPEPATLALFGLGLMGLGVAKRKRRA